MGLCREIHCSYQGLLSGDIYDTDDIGDTDDVGDLIDLGDLGDIGDR